MTGNIPEIYLYFECNNQRAKISCDNVYIQESGILETKFTNGTIILGYTYFTDVTFSYVEFINTFEEEMRKMETEERKEELSKRFSDVVKENLCNKCRCIRKELEMLNRLFYEDIDEVVLMDILEKAILKVQS